MPVSAVVEIPGDLYDRLLLAVLGTHAHLSFDEAIATAIAQYLEQPVSTTEETP